MTEEEFERAVTQLFTSPGGIAVLAEMELRLKQTLFNSDALQMARKVGQLELIEYFRTFTRPE